MTSLQDTSNLQDTPGDLHDAADALVTALKLEDARLIGTIARNARMALAARAGCRADRLATQSLLLRQVERAAQAGAFAEALPIVSAFRAASD